MPRLKLTEAAVERLKAPPGERTEYFDATLPGFGLRVAGPTPRVPEGRKSWVVFYRLAGQQKRLTLEPPFPRLGLGAARKLAGDAMALVAQGIDPAEERARAKEPAIPPETFRTVAAEFLIRGLEKKGRSHSYIGETRRTFANHVLPRWGEKALAEIARCDVIAMLDDIAENGTNRKVDNKKVHAAGGPVTANRTLAAVRACFNFAIRRGLIEVNPCALVDRPGHEQPRDRTLSIGEVKELWPHFEALGFPFGPFFQLCLLTGQRRGEVAGMRWADVDLEAKVWTLSAGQTKANRAHVIPLASMAVEILERLPRMGVTEANGATRPSGLVFTTTGDSPVSGFSRAKAQIETKVQTARGDAERMPAWTIHDLRRTAATRMGRLGVPEFVIAKVLNHASSGITGRVYNTYEYLAEKRHALEAWAAHLLGVVGAAANAKIHNH